MATYARPLAGLWQRSGAAGLNGSVPLEVAKGTGAVRYISAKLSRRCVNHDVASISAQRGSVGLTASQIFR
jgi:hypothetical protein